MKRSSSDTSVLRVGVASFDRINRKFKAGNMQRVFPDAGKYEAKHRKYGLHLWYEIAVPEGEDPETVAAAYQLDENIQTSEPRYKIRSLAMPRLSSLPLEVPSDPDFAKQWNFSNTGQTGGTPGIDIRLPDAWNTVQQQGVKKKVIVAVMDGGVCYAHEDLKDNMWGNDLEINGIAGFDDDGNGYSDDLYGYNFVSRTGGTIVFEDHATHVAGIIAAATNNGIGVSGIAGVHPQSSGIQLMTVQIMSGNRSVSSTVEAFTYAADNGAVIAQNSWGYDQAGYYNQTDVAAINYFIHEAGQDENGNPRPGTPMIGGMVIFAAGNDEQEANWYPACFDNVLAVTAVNHYGKLAWYSNYGDWVDISAPGGDTDERGKAKVGGIYSTSYLASNKDYYEYMQGTSMACPHVSGVAALILSVHGSEHFTPDVLRARLLNNTTSLKSLNPAMASKMGTGLLNAAAAMVPGGLPAKVTDLAANTINAVSCRLDWTVPAVENGGKVHHYIIACATEGITADNFNQYARTPVTVVSREAGAAQRDTITGLHPGTTYYVAVRSVSNLGEISEISNVVVFTTRSNMAPVIVRVLPDIMMRDTAKETAFYLGDVFSDGDGDVMAYEVTIADEQLAKGRIKKDSLLIQPVKAGETWLTLTADDGNTGSVSFDVSLTILLNHAPEISGLFTDTTLIPRVAPVTVDLLKYTTDADADSIIFTYQCSRAGIVDVRIENDVMVIDPQRHGFVTVILEASDPYSASTSTSVNITVEQKYAPDTPGELLVYPNPTNHILNYSFVLDETAPVMVRVVNTAGEVVYQTQTVTRSAGAYYGQIDLSAWGGALYFLQYLKDGKVKDTRKIVRQ